MSSICANWLTVYIVTVNTQHVHVNTLSFNSVLFYFLQDFQLIAWCSDYAFVSCESKYHRECSSQYTRKAGWMKKVFFFCCLFSVNLSKDHSCSARGLSELWHHSYHLTDTVIFRIGDWLYDAPWFWNRSRLIKQNFFQKCCRKWNSDLDWLKGT